MRFEWDPSKNEANRRKHGVGFDEAAELFRSAVDYVELFDEAHSEHEERFIAVGPIRRGLVVVVWAQREGGAVRIIGARWASRREAGLFRRYSEEWP